MTGVIFGGLFVRSEIYVDMKMVDFTVRTIDGCNPFEQMLMILPFYRIFKLKGQRYSTKKKHSLTFIYTNTHNIADVC